MDNQHKLIKGYRDLSWVERLQAGRPGWAADGRWLSIGKTDLQKGFMATIRSIAKPETF